MLHNVIQLEQALAVDARPLQLAVIIPTRNEAANVEPLLSRLGRVLADYHWEAIFVDDNSEDGTADLVRRIGRADSRIRVVHRVGRRGLASAVIEGMMASCAPVLAVIDGDMQHDETILPRLYEAVADGGNDVALGSRYVDGGGVGEWAEGRAAASRLATRLANRLIRTRIADPMSGFFVIRREALQPTLTRLSGGGFKILLDILASSPAPLKTCEIPYVFRTRQHGESKADLKVGLEYLSLLADKTVGRYVPVRLLQFLSVGLLGLAIHLTILGGMLKSGLMGFGAAQGVAVLVAMTVNFALNNLFTYADRRLRGFNWWRGLFSFYAVCLFGAIANVGIGAYFDSMHSVWWLAGCAGALVGAVWNYAASSLLTWRAVK